MERVLTIDQATTLSKQLRAEGKKLVLAGGVFDILHIGHVLFLQKAKEEGDVLFVLLESDEAVKKTKGEGRPINPQNTRAKIVTALRSVDYAILLDNPKTDLEYDTLVISLKPAIIATTSSDSALAHKKRQADLVEGKLKEVIKRISQASTTKIADILKKESI
jgi:rfaE bifunctional protein nucleotidyltransferase chain/domain